MMSATPMGAGSAVLSLRLTTRFSITFILFLLFPLLVQPVDLSLEHPPVLFDVGLQIAFHCDVLGRLVSPFLNRLMISTSIRVLSSSSRMGVTDGCLPRLRQ